jgi:tetratricopeptide (TPR) repeat protein
MASPCLALGELVAVTLATTITMGCAAPPRTSVHRVTMPMGRHHEELPAAPEEAKAHEPTSPPAPEDGSDSAVVINERALSQLRVAVGGPAPNRLDRAATDAATASPAALELAIRIAEHGLELYPDDATLHNTAGLIEIESRRFSEAMSHFERARRIDTGFSHAHYNYAALALQLRDYPAAIDGYTEVLRLEPKSYEARLGLASAISESARPEAARQVLGLLREARDLAPTRPEAYFNAARFTEEVRLRGATDSEPTWMKRLARARCLYASFIVRADPVAYASQIRLAQDHRADMSDIPVLRVRNRGADTTDTPQAVVAGAVEGTCERVGVDGFAF